MTAFKCTSLLIVCLIFPLVAGAGHVQTVLDEKEAVRHFLSLIGHQIPSSRHITISEIKTDPKLSPTAEDICGRLIFGLVEAGHTVGKNDSLSTAVRILGSLHEYSDDQYRLELSLVLPDSIIKQRYQYRNSKETQNRFGSTIFGDMAYLAGGEIEKLSLTSNLASQTSTVNERDFRIGVETNFRESIHSVFSVRTHSSFGRDDIEIDAARVNVHFDKLSLLSGIYWLQLGHESRYLNSTVERSYWDEGLIFDSRVSGLLLTLDQSRLTVDLNIATNRNPSAVATMSCNLLIRHNMNITTTALYVNRDDEFNDVSWQSGIEFLFESKGCFFYALSAKKFFEGHGVNPERRLVTLLLEYEKQLTNRWILKGAYLSISQWLKGDRSIEETIYQEIDLKINRFLTSGFQYERFDLGDFTQTDLTAILYVRPIVAVQLSMKVRYIVPQFGRELLFLGIGGRVRF